MGRVNTPILSKSAQQDIESRFCSDSNHTFRKRCQVILLKAAGRTSKDVGLITGMSHVSVNTWLKRYKAEGIDGLATKPGRGRKPLINKETDEASIILAIKSNRQRLQTAKAEWEKSSGKSVSSSTFKSFLKALVVDINE